MVFIHSVEFQRLYSLCQGYDFHITPHSFTAIRQENDPNPQPLTTTAFATTTTTTDRHTSALLHREMFAVCYGFVDFDSPAAAQKAVSSLKATGVQAQMAKQQEQDPTNLYISNLPVSMDEQELENMLKPLGHVISTRILRDANGVSRGVGFARMESTEKCEVVIQHFNGKYLKTPPGIPAPTEPLLCKFADGGQKKRQSQSKYPQNGRPWHREGETGMALTYDPAAMQNGFYSSPYSIATNRMIAQTSITPFIAASPVSTYQVQSTSWMPHQQYVMQPAIQVHIVPYVSSILVIPNQPVRQPDGHPSSSLMS
ncbi:RNA-binding motif, single-stranded-interacting protein 3-like [Micropterus dolomieu]|uniref:RNA-binding motif, single-stranded-interacting protein 3-like n=1 Tax=Micropterus dolomieu TaxID=147949 RepID=UPI001E8EDDC9|nr:RNA-binding motif, single-stranded-interacting protein 3-like [Micropterus dolomieu]